MYSSILRDESGGVLGVFIHSHNRENDFMPRSKGPVLTKGGLGVDTLMSILPDAALVFKYEGETVSLPLPPAPRPTEVPGAAQHPHCGPS